MLKILAEYKAMSKEELDRRVAEALSTPFGRFLWEVNAEAEEAVREIEKEEGLEENGKPHVEENIRQ